MVVGYVKQELLVPPSLLKIGAMTEATHSVLDVTRR